MSSNRGRLIEECRLYVRPRTRRGLAAPLPNGDPPVFFMVRHNADNQRTTTSLDFLNNKKDCKNLQNNIEDSERREQKQMKTEISDLVMPSRILSYLKILKLRAMQRARSICIYWCPLKGDLVYCV